MRAIVQRVRNGSVVVNLEKISEISHGLVVYIGISNLDDDKDMVYIQDKILNVRIFPDEKGLMNRSVLDIGGEIMIISQFTLFGDARKGRRPSYSEAAPPEIAKKIYDTFLQQITLRYPNKIASGKFQAEMQVFSQVDGPV